MESRIVPGHTRQVDSEPVEQTKKTYEADLGLSIIQTRDLQPVVGGYLGRLQYCVPKFVISLGVLVDPTLPEASSKGGEQAQYEADHQRKAV